VPASSRQVTSQDLVPDLEYALQRAERRARLLPVKALRRVPLGPDCTFYFECFDTLLFQIQEMLLIEKGGPAQVADELAAYNPLIPQGKELVATIMFEIDEPVRRAAFLGALGGVERRFYVEIGGARAAGFPDQDQERSREDGKTSSVHFLRFRLTAQQIANFADPDCRVVLGCGDPRYPHMTELGLEVRRELARDFGS
jgi:hypothetical protein